MAVVRENVIVLFVVILLRYLVIAAVAFLFFYIIRKEKVQFSKIQLKFPQTGDYLREVGYSVITIFIFTAVGWLIFMTPIKAYTKVYWNIDDLGMSYFVISIALILITHDTYFYWTHRAMHHQAIYKIFHRIHHLSVNPSPWAAFAFHPLEAVVEASIIIVIVFLFPLHPLAIGIFLLIMMVYNVYGHLGFELYPRGFSKSPVGKWINTSVNHNQHHQFFKGNYGLYFLWWDRWMGTLREDYDRQFDEVKSRTK